MILTDFSGLIFAALHVDIAGGQKPHMEYIRHLTINSLRHYNVKFRDEFGEMFVIFDDKSWRKQVFEFYKWDRSHNRDNDDNNDWDEIFEHMEEIKADIASNFPFPVIQTESAEADDVIGVLCKNVLEPIVIVSNDKDMGVLTKRRNVKQFRPFAKEFFEVEDPKFFEFELLIKGDKGDGVPSIRCADDFLKTQILQKEAGEKPMRAPAISKKFIAELWEVYQTGDEKAMQLALGPEMYRNFRRNRWLISMDYIPECIEKSVMTDFENVTRNSEMKTLNYMVQKRMSIMAKNIADFKPIRKTSKVSLF